MMKMNAFLFVTLLASLSAPHAEARPKQNSTITFGRSDSLEAQPAKKRSFKHDVEAVSKSHETWKKAHLNSDLYACQRNSERVATLARQVSDKIEVSKKDVVASAKTVEKLLAEALGEKANAAELPAELSSEETAQLQAKLKLVDAAKKKSQTLEHLAGQIMNFYLNDIPRNSAIDGKCQWAYPAAVQKGVATSKQYHADALALSQKLDEISKLAEVAMNERLRKIQYSVCSSQ